MPVFGIDITYLIFVLPAILFSLYAQQKVNGTFQKYATVSNSKGLTGADVARKILALNGITDVTVQHIKGNLTDNFNPTNKTLNLSDAVYASTSVAAIGVAAHECGHAIQHATGYMPLSLRASLVPVANIGSTLSMPLILIGFFIGGGEGLFGTYLVYGGIILFSAAVLFHLVTLPVEFDASSRAINTLDENLILHTTELKPAKAVLNAAAMTYVASAAVSVANLVRLLVLVAGRRRND